MTVGHFVRLQLIGRVTYYLAWIALVCGGLVHFEIARGVFAALSVNKRNLFELSVVCFLICMASELRALVLGKDEERSETTSAARRPVAA
jgi:hypothetical protein